jgi:putative resolvase
MSAINRLLTAKQAAQLLQVSEETIWRWVRAGKMKAVRLPSGRIRIEESEIRRIMTTSQEKDA